MAKRKRAKDIGGHFSEEQLKNINAIIGRVRELLKNPKCAQVLGGTKNARALLNRAQVRYANTIDSKYRGTGGRFPFVASQARAYALDPQSNIYAYSEVGKRGLIAKNIYLNDRFLTKMSPSQQDTSFIHELNRLNGYGGASLERVKGDYANITNACGTADPLGPEK
jgi:hypothetical protein